MITKFKLYENKEPWDSLKGEYVVLKYESRHKDVSKFLENNIGKVTKVYYPGAWFDVEYKNPPERVERYLRFIKDQFNTADIIIHSKDIDDCKAYINSKKFNL